MNVYILPGIKNDEQIVAEAFGIKEAELMKRTRKRKIVDARNFLFWFKMNHRKCTNGAVSEQYGWDHSSINHSVKVVTNLLETDRHFQEKASRAMVSLIKKQEVPV